jgi:hypothetical protein
MDAFRGFNQIFHPVPAGSPTHIDVDGLLTGCLPAPPTPLFLFFAAAEAKKRRKVSPFLQVLLS